MNMEGEEVYRGDMDRGRTGWKEDRGTGRALRKDKWKKIFFEEGTTDR